MKIWGRCSEGADHMCKGPGAGLGLVCWRSSQEGGPDLGAHGRPLVVASGNEGRELGDPSDCTGPGGQGGEAAWRKMDKLTRHLGGKLGSISRLAVCGSEGRSQGWPPTSKPSEGWGCCQQGRTWEVQICWIQPHLKACVLGLSKGKGEWGVWGTSRGKRQPGGRGV